MKTPWVHDVSPFLIQFTHTIGIRYYGLAYLTGFFLAYYFIDLMAKRGTIQMKREQVADFITYAAIGTLVGGRLGYAAFYAPSLFVTFHRSFPFWSLLAVNKGGMASHGGIIGVCTACYLYGRKNKIKVTHLIDLCTFGAGVGIFFGRIANFMNGELYGRPCKPKWYAVKFPSEIYTWGVNNHLNKLRSLGPAAHAVGTFTTKWGQKLSVTVKQWNNWVTNFTNYNYQRNIDAFKQAIVDATYHHNHAVIHALRPVLTPRYPSELIQALLEGLSVFLILAWLWKKPRKPGFISAMFGILYAIMRIIGEEFRMPDFGIGYQWLGLTRGQWLSIIMLAFVIPYFYYVMKQPTQPMGGWNRVTGEGGEPAGANNTQEAT